LSFTPMYGGREPTADEAMATLRRAPELGIDFLDTSDAYGKGRNEAIVGRALAGNRARYVVASKFGNLRLADGSPAENGRPDYVPQACEASLKRLGIETIDLYYLHRVDPAVPIEDTVGAMARLVEQGKVRHLGLSEAGAQTIRRAHAVHPIAALQTEYSLWTRDVEREILPTCRELGIGFVAYSPLGRGFLTGAITGPQSLAAGGDWSAPALLAGLKSFADAEGGFGKFGPALRGVLAAGAVAPDLASALAALGQEEALARIADALSQVQ